MFRMNLAQFGMKSPAMQLPTLKTMHMCLRNKVSVYNDLLHI